MALILAPVSGSLSADDADVTVTAVGEKRVWLYGLLGPGDLDGDGNADLLLAGGDFVEPDVSGTIWGFSGHGW